MLSLDVFHTKHKKGMVFWSVLSVASKSLTTRVIQRLEEDCSSVLTDGETVELVAPS
jgi:hypothetical protein